MLAVLLDNRSQAVPSETVLAACRGSVGHTFGFNALADFQESGWVVSTVLSGTESPDGRRRRLFQLTDRGVAVAEAAKRLVCALDAERERGVVLVP